MARALLIGKGSLLTAAVLKGWLAGGNEIAEIWAAPAERLSRSQQTMQHWAPDWSVWKLARRHGIPVFENPPLRKWPGVAARIAERGADTLITAVTGQIVPQPVLDIFGRNAVNFHPALLPRFRGPAPYLGLLLDGEENDFAGVTLHVLSAGIDEGPIIAQRPVPFDNSARSYPHWLVAHAVAAGELARDGLPRYLRGELPATPQGDGTYRRLGDDATISGARPLAQVHEIIARIGESGHVIARIGDGKVRVRSIRRILGAPTGRAPLRLPFVLQMDVADARVAFRTWTPVDDGLQKLAYLRAIRATDLGTTPG